MERWLKLTQSILSLLVQVRLMRAQKQSMNIINPKELERAINQDSIIFALVVKEAALDNFEEPRKKVRSVLQKFQDVFPMELLNQLPPLVIFNTP